MGDPALKIMKRSIVLIVCLYAGTVLAQNKLEDGASEFQVWTGGGPSVPGGTSHNGVWNAGVRYGWVLTRPHGPFFLKGRFEYAVDVVPLFVVVQKTNTAYGGGVNPLGLKWDFATRGKVAPYLELGGGTLFTNKNVPPGTSAINFTPSGAFGFHFLGKYAWSVEARYLHISNAGLSTPNPGINTFQVRLGIGKFWHK
jgi:Lipid A 3-O-deacylase (PagL)